MSKYRIDVNALLMSSFSATNLRGCRYKLRAMEYAAPESSYVPTLPYTYEAETDEYFSYTLESARQILTVDTQFVGYVEGKISNRYSDLAPRDAPSNFNSWALLLELAPAGVWQDAQLIVGAPAASDFNEFVRDARFCRSGTTRQDVTSQTYTAYGKRDVISGLYEALVDVCAGCTATPMLLREDHLVKAFKSTNFNWFPPKVTGFQLRKVH